MCPICECDEYEIDCEDYETACVVCMSCGYTYIINCGYTYIINKEE